MEASRISRFKYGREKIRKKADVFLTFASSGTNYLVPYFKYKTIRNFDPDRRIHIKSSLGDVYLPPLNKSHRSLIESTRKALIIRGQEKMYAYYIDELSEKIFISRKTLLKSLSNSPIKSPYCKGVIHLKGIIYYFLDLK